jgi:hypothetical protein
LVGLKSWWRPCSTRATKWYLFSGCYHVLSVKTGQDGKVCLCKFWQNAHAKSTRARACAIGILKKRTLACDVRAAEDWVCECACVRGKKSSQLTVCLLSPRFHRLYGFAWLEIGLAAEWGSQVVVLKLACNPNLVMIDWNLLISWIIRCSILVSFGIAWVLKFEENITFRFRWELSLRTVDKLWCDSTFWELLKGFKLDNSFSTILWNQVFSQMFQKVRNLLLQFYLKFSRVFLCPRLKKNIKGKILSVIQKKLATALSQMLKYIEMSQ